MRLPGIRLYRRSLLQVGQGLGKSAIQKQHAPQKQVCAVMVWLSLEDDEQVFGCFLRPSSTSINGGQRAAGVAPIGPVFHQDFGMRGSRIQITGFVEADGTLV